MPNSRMFCPPKIEMFRELRAVQDVSQFKLDGAELLHMLSMFDPYGAWRLDIESGLVYWTRDSFEIHGMKPTPGPVNLSEAMKSYHPEDRVRLAGAISDVIRKRSGYRAILRLAVGDGAYKYIKTNGQFRVNPDGHEEIFGIYTILLDREPAMALVE